MHDYMGSYVARESPSLGKAPRTIATGPRHSASTPHHTVSTAKFPSSRIVTRDTVYEHLATAEHISNGHTRIDENAISPEQLRASAARKDAPTSAERSDARPVHVRADGEAADDDQTLREQYERIRRELFLPEDEAAGAAAIRDAHRTGPARARPRGRYESTLAATPRAPPQPTWMESLRGGDVAEQPVPASPARGVASPYAYGGGGNWGLSSGAASRAASPTRLSPPRSTPRSTSPLGHSPSIGEMAARSRELADAAAWSRKMAHASPTLRSGAMPPVPAVDGGGARGGFAGEIAGEIASPTAVASAALTRAAGRGAPRGSAEPHAALWSMATQAQLNGLDPRSKYTHVLDRYEAFVQVRQYDKAAGVRARPGAFALREPISAPSAAGEPRAPHEYLDDHRLDYQPASAERERPPWTPAAQGRYEPPWRPPFQDPHVWPVSSRRYAELRKTSGRRLAS